MSQEIRDEFLCVETCMKIIENLNRANSWLYLNPSISHSIANKFYSAVQKVRKMAIQADILLHAGGKGNVTKYYQKKFESCIQKELEVFKQFLLVKSTI